MIYALSARHFVLWEPQHVAERLRISTEIIRHATEADDQERILWGHNYRIANLLEMGEGQAAKEELTTFSRLATELRHPRYLWAATELQSLWALLDGRFSEVERLSQQALAIGQRVGRRTARLLFNDRMMSLRWEQGRLQEMVESRTALGTQYPVARASLAWIYSEIGREAEARREFGILAADDFANISRDVSWLLSLSYLARVCAFLGDTHKASLLYSLLLPHKQSNVVVPGAIVFHGSVSHLLGLLATTLSSWADGEQHFLDALAMYTKLNARSYVAHTQSDYARMLLIRAQPGDVTKARELLDLALATAQELGMARLESQVQGLKSKVQAGQVPGSKFQVSRTESSSQKSESPLLQLQTLHPELRIPSP